MYSERLPTKLWVEALIHRVQLAGASAFIQKAGDASRGDVLVKVANLQGQAKLYRPRTTLTGERVFVDLSAQKLGDEEPDIDSYITRECHFDSDLWVIEIEDRDLRNFITESIQE